MVTNWVLPRSLNLFSNSSKFDAGHGILAEGQASEVCTG